MTRCIAHLDMDAFFASVELLAYPQLGGLPVVVGGRRAPPPRRLADGSLEFARLAEYRGRGVLTTATYPARALGLHSGMSIMQAARLAPQAILLPANFEAYRAASRGFKAAVAAIAPHIEDRGIDEIYIDLGGLVDVGDTQALLALARRIKEAVYTATRLTCSLGIAPNKLLAKICSDLDKPDGITLLSRDDVPARLGPLPVRKINGVGPRADEKLARLGIRTIGELAAADPLALQRHFGHSYGLWLHQAAHGIDDSPLVTHREPKSVSRETTFERDLSVRADRDALRRIFDELCQRVASDLQGKNLVGRTIGIKLRYADFTTVTRDLTLPETTADPRLIRRAAGECLRRVDLERRLRLLGVRVSGLAPHRPETSTDAAGQSELPLGI